MSLASEWIDAKIKKAKTQTDSAQSSTWSTGQDVNVFRLLDLDAFNACCKLLPLPDALMRLCAAGSILEEIFFGTPQEMRSLPAASMNSAAVQDAWIVWPAFA